MEKAKIAILISGGGTNAQSVIDATKSGEIPNGEVCVVISDTAGAYGLQRAKNSNIPAVELNKKVFADKQAFYNRLFLEIEKSKADMVVLAGFLSIVPKEIVNAFQGRMINIHPSLIPKYSGMGFYGHKVHEAVIANGEKFSGATVHFVETGVDTGQIILQEKVPVLKEDTPDTLAARVLETEHKILVQAVRQLTDQIVLQGSYM